LKPLAEKYYGVIPAQPPTLRQRAKEPPQQAERRVTLRDKRVTQPSWRRVYLAPGMQWGARENAYPLEVLADIIGSGSSSRLYRSLVINQKLAVSAGVHYSGDNRGPGQFILFASPRSGVDMDVLEAAVMKEMDNLIENGVSQDELDRAKSRMLSEAVYARDSLSGGARVIGSALAAGLTIDDVENWPDRISDVSRSAINKALKSVFKADRSVTGLLLPADNS